jgi:hypothetical protein
MVAVVSWYIGTRHPHLLFSLSSLVSFLVSWLFLARGKALLLTPANHMLWDGCGIFSSWRPRLVVSSAAQAIAKQKPWIWLRMPFCFILVSRVHRDLDLDPFPGFGSRLLSLAVRPVVRDMFLLNPFRLHLLSVLRGG